MKKIILLLTLAAFAFGASDQEVCDFITNIIKKNPGLTPKSVKVFDRKKIAKYDRVCIAIPSVRMRTQVAGVVPETQLDTMDNAIEFEALESQYRTEEQVNVE